MNNKELNKKCGERIRELRNNFGLGRTDLILRAGIKGKDGKKPLTEQAFKRWEEGECMPKKENAEALAKVFNVRPDYILGISDYKTQAEQNLAFFRMNTSDFDFDVDRERFCQALDVFFDVAASSGYRFKDSGEEVPEGDEDPMDESMEYFIEPFVDVSIGGKNYRVSTDKWDAIIESVMMSAHATIEALCLKSNALSGADDGRPLPSESDTTIRANVCLINEPYDPKDGTVTISIFRENWKMPVLCPLMTGKDDEMKAILPRLRKGDEIIVKGKRKMGSHDLEPGSILLKYIPSKKASEMFHWRRG